MIRFPVRTFVLSLVLVASGACAADEPGKAPSPADLAGHALEAAPSTDKTSIYQLDSTWTSSTGKPLQLSALRGKVRVLAIFYSSCQYACPIIVGRMKSVQAGIPTNLQDGVGFVLVSMDPEHDDPARLRAYAERMDLKGDWTLLHGSDGDVRELGAVLGFRYRQEKDGGYSHSNMITVLDREGRVAHQSIGLDADASDAVAAVKKLLIP
jgi:protein SCO1